MLSAPISPLRNNQILSSRRPITARAVDEAQQTISELFCEHTLTPLEKREVQMSLRSAHDTDLGIEVLDYGEAVRIHVDDGLESFHLVQVPLSGKATMSVGNAMIQSSSSVATLPPLDRSFTMNWARETPTLILYVSRERLQQVARQLYGLDNGEQLELALQMQMSSPEGVAFIRSLTDWHDVMENAGANTAYIRKLSAELLLARMLSAVENSASKSLGAWENASSGVRTDGLAQKFSTAIEDGVEYGFGVFEIADQLGVPVRTLQEHVRSAFNSTPSAMLREARLQHAHRLLSAGDSSHETVTVIAQQCGFGHLGRFSSDYRARFGETPAQTLRR
jgi:Helix-turn-helix domain/AraC-binding-like domain